MQLTTHSKNPPLNYLLQAPFTLQSGLIERIDREAANSHAAKPARIVAKINGLVSQRIIQALYEASRAGVKIDLIVRGVCCLRPGMAGVSENIHVRSIVGRFLEHTRVYYFENGGEESEVFCASADWMPRNLVQRVEQCFPILDKDIKRRIIDDLEVYLSDNCQAWALDHEANYSRVTPQADEPRISAQQRLLDLYAGK